MVAGKCCNGVCVVNVIAIFFIFFADDFLPFKFPIYTWEINVKCNVELVSTLKETTKARRWYTCQNP